MSRRQITKRYAIDMDKNSTEQNGTIRWESSAGGPEITITFLMEI